MQIKEIASLILILASVQTASAGSLQCVTAVKSEQTSLVDEGGNPIPRKAGIVAKIFRRDPLKKFRQKSPLTPSYFLDTFDAELEQLVSENVLTYDMLTDLHSRLFSIEDQKNHDQFYLLRTDEDPSRPLDDIDKKNLYIFSFDAKKMVATKSALAPYVLKKAGSRPNTSRALNLQSFAGSSDRLVPLAEGKSEIFSYRIAGADRLLRVLVTGEQSYDGIQWRNARETFSVLVVQAEGAVTSLEQVRQLYRKGD